MNFVTRTSFKPNNLAEKNFGNRSKSSRVSSMSALKIRSKKVQAEFSDLSQSQSNSTFRNFGYGANETSRFLEDDETLAVKLKKIPTLDLTIYHHAR